MNKIKKFFKDKEVEQKFKKAGVGHRLCDEKEKQVIPKSSGARNLKPGTSQDRSEAGRRAAEAALSRIQQNKTNPVDWSLSAVRAQAKKELQQESEASEKAEHAPKEPKEVVQESCPVLTVSGVYFNCALIGPDVLTRREIDQKIEEFLYDQLPEERGLTACLIIRTCNKDKEKVNKGVELIEKIITNVINNPTEEKFRKIRVNNKTFKERVLSLKGVHDFLSAVGFDLQEIKPDDQSDSEQFYVFPEEKLADLENVQMLMDALLTAEPICPTLDRNIRVLLPSQASAKITLPDDFFNLSVEELLKEQEARLAAVDLNSQLRTKEMRKRDEIREIRHYRYTLVRIRFPDGIILQGTFSVKETLDALLEYIRDNLAYADRQFSLLAPGAVKLSDPDMTLSDLKLVPAALLTLHWQDDDASIGCEVAYLKPETLNLLQDM